jgi:hypothetical protein
MGMSIDHSYIVAPVEYTTWEDELSVSIGKYPDGNFIRIGLCFPLNSTISVEGKPQPEEVSSMEKLMDDSSGLAYFLDREVGVVFRRLEGKETNQEFKIRVENLASEDVDCTTRAYPKYQNFNE